MSLSIAVGLFWGSNALAATVYTVTTLADTTGSCSGASCTTLRAAITAANGSTGNTINFTGLSGTITLTSALPAINQSMTITGPGASSLTISGNAAYQIFNISSGAVNISGLTIANGNSDGANSGGGAIYNSATLTVTDSTFSGNSGGSNSVSGAGGAIDSSGTLTVTNSTFSGNSVWGGGSFQGNGGAIENSGTLTMSSSTLSGNSALDFGGAIYNTGTLTLTDNTFSGNTTTSNGGAISSTGTLMVTNSTFSGNSGGYQAAGGAGAIYNDGTMAVTGSTFSGNSGNYGGAICNLGSSATLDDNIFTGNSSQYGKGAGILDYGSAVNASYNLYYENLDAGATEDDCNNCVTNTNAIAGSNPLLAALGSYGGATQTVLPQPGSPAICAGSTSLIPSGVTTDQRGFSRTTTYNSTACVDLGAVQTRYTAVAFSSSSYSGVVNQAVNPAPVVTVTENGQNIGGVPITLAYSGTGSPTGLGPVTTAGGTGATFSSLTATAAAQGTLTVSLPITGSGNSVQPPALTASATLNIQPIAQTITFVALSPLTYGYAPLTLTATGGASGNQVIFSLDAASTPGAAVLSGNTLTITGVGTIVIDANQAAGVGYAAAAQVQQRIVVNPAPLTITASSPTVIYGSPVPTITPIFGTFFNGDTSAVLTRQPTCVTAYTATSAAGSLPSTSCSGAAAANYTFTYVNGSVIVNPGPTFVIGGSASINITPGATAGNTVSITVTPSNGFTGTVNLSCSISPVAASDPPSCSLSPASVTITGTGAQASTLTISTTASTVGENQLKRLLWPSAGTALALGLMIGVPRRRRGWLTLLCVLALSIAAGGIGCGGGGSGSSAGNSGTASGTYAVTVTGTSGSVTRTGGTITLTVQ